MTNDLSARLLFPEDAIGPPPPPRFFIVPHSPGANYVWVNGYWYPLDGRYVWHDGYWTQPPYPGAKWVSPRYEGNRFYDGYWEGDCGRVDHNSASGQDRDRDLRVRHRLDWVTG